MQHSNTHKSEKFPISIFLIMPKHSFADLPPSGTSYKRHQKLSQGRRIDAAGVPMTPACFHCNNNGLECFGLAGCSRCSSCVRLQRGCSLSLTLATNRIFNNILFSRRSWAICKTSMILCPRLSLRLCRLAEFLPWIFVWRIIWKCHFFLKGARQRRLCLLVSQVVPLRQQFLWLLLPKRRLVLISRHVQFTDGKNCKVGNLKQIAVVVLCRDGSHRVC